MFPAQPGKAPDGVKTASETEAMATAVPVQPSGEPIPQPPAWPVIGNLLEIDRHAPVQSFMRLARKHGPIFWMHLPGRRILALSGPDLVAEACDESRFDKVISTPLRRVRAFTGDGLFTAWTSEPNWQKAHNILLPNFGLKAMQGYMPQMVDIALQLIAKWERKNPDDVIDVADDMTRLTLDTIGLCGFDYRFNSFYRDQPHPFVRAMVSALGEALMQTNRLPIQEALLFRRHRAFERDVALMNSVVDRLIRERRADSSAMATKQDLLNAMLTGVDRQSGERLDDLNIRYQILTFLIAGHETTSGLLSFALYFLMKHPDVLARAQDEVDRVLDPDPAVPPTHAQVHRLRYVQRILKESLRLWPTAPAFGLYARADTTIGGGRYLVPKGQGLAILVPMLHRDRSVWGADVESFDPAHFDVEREMRRPPHAFKPFGNGQRACIGQQFAMQEATLVLGMIVRRFDLIDHAGYQLRIKETLTLKPDGLTLKVQRRARRSRVSVAALAATAELGPEPSPPAPTGAATPLLVLFGSNLGTAEGLAHRIAADGKALGFKATVSSLDGHAGDLPRDAAVIIVTASYNGMPPDNAARFCEWLRQLDAGPAPLRGVRYALFGCGDRNWAATYQAVPKLVDERLAACGATRIAERGEGDADGDFDADFRAWYGPIWSRIGAALGLEIQSSAPARTVRGLRIEVMSSLAEPPIAAAVGARRMSVVANRELQQRDGPDGSRRSTRHIELALPEGVTYRTGDHLGILPRNRPALVKRVLHRYGLDAAARVVIRADEPGPPHLPLGALLTLSDLLSGFVELQDPATRDQVRALADRTQCPPERAALAALAGDNTRSEASYRDRILACRVSMLDLLEQFPSCGLPFEELLGLLPPLRPRYYSISSSPLVSERVASLTVAVVDAPARSGRGQYEGVASGYLAGLAAGAEVLGFVRGPGTPFRPPDDPRTPMIMVGAGTGLAPFRGFLQERAALAERGQEVGPSLLVFGCRRREHDFLYEDELREFEARGITRLVTAFSRQQGQPKCYVQHKVAEHAEEVWGLIERGAVIFVCGDAAGMAPDVQSAFVRIISDRTGGNSAVAERGLADLRAAGRYLEDVWAST